MGRYIEAVCRLCRREGEKLFLKGERCFSEKCAVVRRKFPPGPHQKMMPKASEYRIRLREKQKARRIYGLTERQFKGYYLKALRTKGSTGEKLLEFLERRLDNVVYRLGFASSRAEARQLVRHGQILIRGKKINIPSYQVKTEDTLSARTKVQPRLKINLEKFPDRVLPAWLTLTADTEAKIVSLPKREDIAIPFEEQLIVEYYSR